MDLIDRLREYASTRKGKLAELITEAADALERQPCDDAVSRAAAIAAVSNWLYDRDDGRSVDQLLSALPSAQPDYKEVLGWLLAYHTISFDLHGRYLPHEVISWLINDFTKEFIAGRGQNE